jgi:hypothetical protein
MERIGRAALRLVTLLLLLTLAVACSAPGRAQPTATPGDEPPTELPVGEPATDTPEPPATADVPPETPPDTPVAPTGMPETPSATAPTAVPPTTAPTAPPTTPPTATQAPHLTTSPLSTYRLVTYYGHPASAQMGILGETDPATMVEKLKQQTAAFTAADPSRPAICTIELIASVAQGSPGPEGLWLLRTSPKDIEKYAQLAEQNGCLLMLDIQMGYDTVANDVQAILPFLKRPYVHLAIDPEFHVKPGQVPGEHYGSVTAAEVLGAAKTLSTLVQENNIPDKILVIHQFRDNMLPDKGNIKPVPNVDMVVMMDGWGSPASKVNNYTAFVHDELIQYGGVKLFYRQDDPLMTPQEVLQLDPSPMVIIYQ